jgi:type II restriction enzyme
LLYRSNPFVIASVLCFICGTSLSILLHFPFIRRSNLIRVSLIRAMNLSLPTTDLHIYRSASQRARIGTEAWGASNLFCLACDSPRLSERARNCPATDFVCPVCGSRYELKSQSRPFGTKILDSAYSQMKKAIVEDRTPNLFALEYDIQRWIVRTVVLIPRFAFTLSAVERRKPLAPTARRAGWVGCNILLNRIPEDARICLVKDGVRNSPADARRAYERLRPLEDSRVEVRGWTLDVLQLIRCLRKTDFKLNEIYSHAAILAKLHPHNAHVHAKIRQQLQLLRDLGLIAFLGRGCYRLK